MGPQTCQFLQRNLYTSDKVLTPGIHFFVKIGASVGINFGIDQWRCFFFVYMKKKTLILRVVAEVVQCLLLTVPSYLRRGESHRSSKYLPELVKSVRRPTSALEMFK